VKTAGSGSGWDADANDNIRLELSLSTMVNITSKEGLGHALPEKEVVASAPWMPYLLNLPKRIKDWIALWRVFREFL
jgi:hypothetical protein